MIDTMVIPVEEIRQQAEADERTKGRNRRRRALAWLAILLFVLAVAAIVIWRLLR